ncbi:MAG: hypothetical protein IJ058_07295 [Lachnospiraceae bacterium]|nr:hypothetical protein [Lachnospiraceae bacterium]
MAELYKEQTFEEWKAEEKRKEQHFAAVDESLLRQKDEITKWMDTFQNQEDYMTSVRQKTDDVNRKLASEIKGLFGVNSAVPLKRKAPDQTVPVAKYWWLSRHREASRLKKAQKKYGQYISVNSLRERKDMNSYEKIREMQRNESDSSKRTYCKKAKFEVKGSSMLAKDLKLGVEIDGYDRLVKRYKLDDAEKYYIRTDEIEKGLTPFMAMQKSRWLFWKKTVGALGTETREEKNDAAEYNKNLMKRYTKSKEGSPERTAVLDELRAKFQNFRITPEMLTDRYLADNSIQLRRFAEMTQAFRILIATNPGYLETLSEEDRIMLGNTLNYTGPLILDFLEQHQRYKHITMSGRKAVFRDKADDDLSKENDQLRVDTWNKIHAADIAEQAKIGLSNKRVQKYLTDIEDEAKARRKNEELPAYAITLKYDNIGYDEDRLLTVQNKIRDENGAYELVGADMEKLFGQYSKDVITMNTLSARITALSKAKEDHEKALKESKGKKGNVRRYSAFIDYAEAEINKMNQDKTTLQQRSNEYELALDYVTGIRLTDDDMQIPGIEEKYKDTVAKVLKNEDLSFLLRLEDCRFYAKEFTELTGGEFKFRTVMKDAIARGRGEEMRIHTEKFEKLEKDFGDHKLENYQIFALKPEALEKYNFNGFMDRNGVMHKGALDLTDEENFKHMMELKHIAEADYKELRIACTRMCMDNGYSDAELLDHHDDLEIKYNMLKDYYQKWKGAYDALNSESYKFLAQVPDMEGQNGIFKDPKVFAGYKDTLQKKLDKVKKDDPGSADVKRYEDMIRLMNGMMLRNGMFSENDEDVRVLNAETYHARIKQLKYDRRLEKMIKFFKESRMLDIEKDRLIKMAQDVILYEDRYAKLAEKHGKTLDDNLMQAELDKKLAKAKTEDDKNAVKSEYLAGKAVEILELRNKLTPQFFTEDYIHDNFEEFAETALTIRDFGKLVKNQEDFDLMEQGLSEEKRDELAGAVDVMLQISNDMELLLYSAFSAHSVDFMTGKIGAKADIIRKMFKILPDDKLAQEYRDGVKEINEIQDKRNARANKQVTLDEANRQLKLAAQDKELYMQAYTSESELAEDYLDKTLTDRLQKLRSRDYFAPDRRRMLDLPNSPTEELYRYLYEDKEFGKLNLSYEGNKEGWDKALESAFNKTSSYIFFRGLSQEARNVAKDMMKNPQKIEDYLQWRARQDSRVYMNERSKALGIKESVEDTAIAYEIMNSMEETHTSVHNSANRKMRLTVFPELEKKGIDPEQFMHLLRVVHRNTSGLAGRLVDITNQSVNMKRSMQYLSAENKSEFILQATTEVMKFELEDNMLSEEYLKQPGNFSYMYFMAQKLKAYEQLYMKDRESVEKALTKDTDHKALFQKVHERFGTFYGNISDQVYRLVMNFAAKYGVNQQGVRTFGLDEAEYEQLTQEGQTKTFASRSKENMKQADKDFNDNVTGIRKRNAQRKAAIGGVDAIHKYDTYGFEKWLTEKPKRSKDIVKNISADQQYADNKIVTGGMEKAMLMEDRSTARKNAKKKVEKLDNRFRVGDVAYLLTKENYVENLRSDREQGERNDGVLRLMDLFSDNSVLQMNFLLDRNRLDDYLETFERNEKLLSDAGKNMASEEFLEKNLTEQFFIDARTMAVVALLPTIIPNLFKDSFIKQAGPTEKSVKNSTEYEDRDNAFNMLTQQSDLIRKQAMDDFKNDKITKEQFDDMIGQANALQKQAYVNETDRDRLLPKLKDTNRDGVIAGIAKLKKYIGTEKQRELYKNLGNFVQKYVRVCGVNLDSPDNSIGALVSGMNEDKLKTAQENIVLDFKDSMNALKSSI